MTRPNRWKWKKNHYAQIWTVMQKVFASETWESTLSDKKLTEAIRDLGVYTTPTVTRAVRELHGVGSHEERRVQLFAKSKNKK